MTGPSQVKAAGTKPATKQVTIGAGVSLSAAVDLNDHRLRAIAVPSGWDAADITFQASENGTDYFNLHEASTDTEVTVQAAASRFIVVNKDLFSMIRFLKVRSGTAGAAVNQADAVTLALVVAP